MAKHRFTVHSLPDVELSRELLPPTLFGEEHTRAHTRRSIEPIKRDSVRLTAKFKDKRQSK